MNAMKEKIIENMREKRAECPIFLQMKLKISYEEAQKICDKFIKFVQAK